MSVLIPFARYQDRWVSVDEVDRGNAGAVCGDCGSPLVARKGDQKVHHFAHMVDGRGSRCSSRGETALHGFAKDYLGGRKRAGKRLKLASLDREGQYGGVDYLISQGRTEYHIREIDKTVDVLLTGKVICPKRGAFDCYLGVEICVTHPKTAEDIAAFRRVKQLSVIEIDLSMDAVVEHWWTRPKPHLRNTVAWLLMSGSGNRRWLVKPREAA